MTQNEFIKSLENININLTEKQLNQLNQYYELLIEYNKIMNLTSITEKEEVYLKHFYDSITISTEIDLSKEETLCDIGTGAGFPGLVLKIVFPNLKITLLDSLNKRIKFLEEVIKILHLENIEVVHSRAEEYAINNRNKFDITTARAVAHLSILLEYAIPMTKPNKYFIAMKANIDEELKETANALKELSTEIVNINKFNLPKENSNRTIISFKKNNDIKKYPRKNKEIKLKKL